MRLRPDHRVAGLLGEREPLLVRGRRGRGVVRPVGETADRGQRDDVEPDVRRRRDEEPVERLPALPQDAPLLEPSPDGCRHAEACGRVAGPERPRDRGPNVVLLAVESPNGELPCRSEDPGAGSLGHRGHGGGVPALDVGALAGLLETLERVFAEQRVQVEAGLGGGALRRVGRLDPDEALVGERLEALEDVDAEVAVRDRRPAAPARPSSRRRRPPRRRKSRRSGSDSRSWLQAIAPRSVRWRSGRSRDPPARSRLDVSRSRISAGLRSRTRAAASSIASGRPDRRSQICRTICERIAGRGRGPAGGPWRER